MTDHNGSTDVSTTPLLGVLDTNHQGCGSGLDPDSIGSVDPDPDSESRSGCGSRRAKMTHKSRKFFMLDGLF
jgi:hypothetical protein